MVNIISRQEAYGNTISVFSDSWHPALDKDSLSNKLASQSGEVEIRASGVGKEYIIAALRCYENKQVGLKDECIYCSADLTAKNRDGNVCLSCNSF